NVSLHIYKENSLLGMSDPSFYEEPLHFLNLLSDTIMHTLKKQKDYRLLSEIPLVISLQKEKCLLGASAESFQEFLDYVNSFGKFKLSVEMDAKMGKDGGYIIAHLKGDTKMIY